MLGSFGGGGLQGQMTLTWILMLPAMFLTLNWLHGWPSQDLAQPCNFCTGLTKAKSQSIYHLETPQSFTTTMLQHANSLEASWSRRKLICIENQSTELSKWFRGPHPSCRRPAAHTCWGTAPFAVCISSAGLMCWSSARGPCILARACFWATGFHEKSYPHIIPGEKTIFSVLRVASDLGFPNALFASNSLQIWAITACHWKLNWLLWKSIVNICMTNTWIEVRAGPFKT